MTKVVLATMAATALALAACGDGKDPMVQGTWRLVRATGTAQARTNGLLRIEAIELAGTTISFADSGLASPFAPVLAAQAPYTAGGGALALAGQTPASLPFSLDDGSPEELTVTPSTGVSLVFQRYAHQRSETFMVRGTVRLASAPPAMPLHAALVFLVRDGGATGFNADPRDVAALTFTGQTATFVLDRDEGARGTERVPFGTAGIAVGLVVVYEDRTGPGQLDDLFDSDCTPGGTAKDCVRGVSPVLLGYRDSVSPELTATPYALLLDGWSPALTLRDTRGSGNRTGVASLDPTGTMIPFDVEVPAAPGTISLPELQL